MTTFQDMLGGEGERKHVVYILRSPRRAEYVGETDAPIGQRLAQHIAESFAPNPSGIEKVLKENRPTYLGWEVVCLTPDEARTITGKPSHCKKCAERDIFDFYRRDDPYTLIGNLRTPYRCIPERDRRKAAGET